MNTNSIAINTAALKSIRLGCADKDVRYYLKGVLFSCDGKTLRLTSSNGHILLTHTKSLDVAIEPFEIIVPSESVDVAIKLTGKALVLRLDITEDGKYTLAGIPITPIDGRYPKAENIWPKPEMMDGKPCTVNPEYFSIVGKVSKLMGVGVAGAEFWHDSGKIVFQSGDKESAGGTVRGLIMGLRTSSNHTADTLPNF